MFCNHTKNYCTQNSVNVIIGEGGKNMIKEREANHKRLLKREQTEGFWRGVGWVDGIHG